MTAAHKMPSPYDSDFWRLRARLLKRANGTPLSELALLEARRSLDRAAHWNANNQEASVRGEHRRAERMRVIADLEKRDPPFRFRILHLRASELLQHGQAAPAKVLTDEANGILRQYLPTLSTNALKAHNARQIIDFAEASLTDDPNGPHARRLRELIASARRTVQRAQHQTSQRLAG